MWLSTSRSTHRSWRPARVLLIGLLLTLAGLATAAIGQDQLERKGPVARESTKPTAWRRSAPYIGGGLLVLIQAGLIAFLIAQRTRLRRARRGLDERLAFEQLLSELSVLFAETPAREIDGQFAPALRRVVAALGLDRARLGEFTPDGQIFLSLHVATAEGIPTDATDLSGDNFPWTTDQMRRGHVVRYSQLDELPAEATVDRQSGLAIGTRSMIAIPLVGVGGVTCVLALSTLRRERPWPDDLVQRLELLGSIFAGALARSRAETAMEESEGRFRLAADAAPVMMWMAGLDAGCTYFNRGWLEFTGRRVEEEVGDGWAEGVHPDDRAACQASYLQAFNAREPFTLEYRLRRFDGDYRWLLDHGVPRFSRGGFTGYIGTCLDVTEIRASQQEARLQREELAHALRVATMGEMAASLAHEINQPLAAIVANAQAAQRLAHPERPGSEDLHDALADIASDARRAAQVVRRVRALFTKDHSEQRPLAINELITEVTGLLASDITRHRVALHVRLGSALPPVLGDSIQLQQVLLNLVLNACQAMTEVEAGSRELTIESAEREPGLLEIRVRDSGPGVKDLELERIFEPFVSTKTGGLGMGLSISRSIVAAHGGRIWATRNSDTGITVHVELPT